MTIADPETDINLWITVVSQSLSIPEQLFNCLHQIDQVFSDVIEDEKSLSTKYQISPSDFYYSVLKHILIPLLQLTEIHSTDEYDTVSLISDLLILFLKLSSLFLTNEDESIRNMLLLLFYQESNLYKINSTFYQAICDNFLYLGFYADFLNYIEKINQMPQTLNSAQAVHDQSTTDQITELTRMMKKLPFLARIETRLIPLVEDEPDIDFKTFCYNLMRPLLQFPKFSNDIIAFDLFLTVTNQLNDQNYFNPEILKFWLQIFKTFLTTGSFSLTLFSIRAITNLIQNGYFKNCVFNFLKQEEFHQLVKLYMNVSIRSEFIDFLKVIYSSFLVNKIISVDDLLPIWERRKASHISVRTVLYSIFDDLSKNVPNEEIEQFTNMVLSNIQLTKEWLHLIVKCAFNLNQRSLNNSAYVNLLKKINDLNFDFIDFDAEKLNDNEVMMYKEIAESGLSVLLVGSFNSANFSDFLKEISIKIESKRETVKDMEILCQSLTKLSNSKTLDLDPSFLQQFLSDIISIFDRHNINMMEEIVRILLSDPYNCRFEQSFIKVLLSLTFNENICSSIYSFLTELCLAMNQIPIDLLLNEMMAGNCVIGLHFYRTIKSIILNLNNGCTEITSFPFVKEEVLWHFCFNDNNQIKRFQHFLSRIYMRAKTSDEEMIQSFIMNWMNGFKKFYYSKENDDEYQDEIIDQFFLFLNIFLKKIEYFIYTPIQYHFSQYKTNKVQIQIDSYNGEFIESMSKPFYFDQRRSISALEQYIKLRHSILNDIEICFNDQFLNKRESIEDEIGYSDIFKRKSVNQPVIITIEDSQTNTNTKKKPLYVNQNRTIYPSVFIVDTFKGIIEILFKFDKYNSILYNLPTFNETLIQIKNLTNDDFQKYFPYNKPNVFRYYFESFLDYYSTSEFNLLSKDPLFESDQNQIFKNPFIRKSGIIDYFISCGLSMTDETLVNMLLIFLRDYSFFNREILDNEILNEQLLNMIQQFIDDPKSIPKSTINIIFTFKLKSIKNLTKEQIYQLLIGIEIDGIREGAREFLKDVYVPLSYYSYSYDESDSEPNKTFYLSWSDHILISKEKNEETNHIIMCNLRRTNAPLQYFKCIESALIRNMFSVAEFDKIIVYLTKNFILDQINLPPKPSFNIAIMIASNLYDKRIYSAFDMLFNSIEKFDLMVKYLNDCGNYGDGYEEYPVFNGDQINFRYCDFDSHSISINCIENPIGLKNLGATCYINVIIQQLFNVTDFRNKLNSVCQSKLSENCEDKNSSLILSLNELFIELERSFLGVADPTDFIEILGVDVKIHNDCCEFFLQLIDRLGIDLFNGKFRHTIAAIDDGNLRVDSFEDFTVLPLSIRGISNINESLDHLFEIDYFTGDNGYIFENNNGNKVDVKKWCSIHSLSSHLIIQLERFEYNHQTQEREKISSFFEFDEFLIIDDQKFILTGVIIHIGESAESGHYISYIRKPDSRSEEELKTYTNKWFKYNDSNVTSVPYETVMDDGFENGYLLFYTEMDSNIIDDSDYSRIDHLNRESSLCRMIYSRSLFNGMMNMICDMKNLERFGLSAIYFFKFLNAYDDENCQEMYSNKLLACIKQQKEKDDQKQLKVILNLWNQISFENPLMFSKWRCIRWCTCEILKEVIDSGLDCLDQLKKLILNSIDQLYSFFYSSSEFFDLVNHALQLNGDEMMKIIEENEIDIKLMSLFVKICVNKNSIDFDCVESSAFFDILIKLGTSDEMEEALLNNIDVVDLLLSSQTSVDVIARLISCMKRKDDVVALLNSNEENGDKMLILLQQL